MATEADRPPRLELYALEYYDPSAGNKRKWFTDRVERNKVQRQLYTDGCGGFETWSLMMDLSLEGIVKALNWLEVK